MEPIWERFRQQTTQSCVAWCLPLCAGLMATIPTTLPWACLAHDDACISCMCHACTCSDHACPGLLCAGRRMSWSVLWVSCMLWVPSTLIRSTKETLGLVDAGQQLLVAYQV